MLFRLLINKSTIVLFISFYFLLFSENGICRTPHDLDRIIQKFNQSQTPDEQLELSYRGLDLYAPLTQKSQVDPDDRVVMSRMKRLVLTNALDRAGKDILVTAVGTTGYWVLKNSDRIVNDYPAGNKDRIVQLKRKGCYMEGLSDLDFVVMGPKAAAYQNNIYRILAQGVGDTHLMPDELENLEISFLIDDQVRDLASGPKGRKFWKQLMNLEDSSPHPEKYITRGGKALYGMEHLFEGGAVAVSNQGTSPSLFSEYANKSGHHMGPFTLVHLFGGACDMDYFISHALEKRGQEGVKTVLQIIKYLKRQEWMLNRAAKNINKLPADLDKRPETLESLKNYASDIAAFTAKAVNQKVWKSPQAKGKFGKEAQSLSGVISSFAHECLIETGNDLLFLRKKKRLTKETRALLSSIVFDLTTVDEERYPHKYPSWYAYEEFVRGEAHSSRPRDETLYFLKRYRGDITTDDTDRDGPVISMPVVKKKKKMDTGPITPPPIANIKIKKVQVSPEKPLAGAPVTFTVSGTVHGVSETMPDFTKNEYIGDQQTIMEKLGEWSLRATLYRMQIQYLLHQDKKSREASSSSDKIYVSPYEIVQISEDWIEPSEDEIAILSKKLDREVSDDKSGEYALRVRPVPSIQSIKDYIKAFETTCEQANVAFKAIGGMTKVIIAAVNPVSGEDDSLRTGLAEFSVEASKGVQFVGKTIKKAGILKKRFDQLEGLYNLDPSKAAEIAGEIQSKLEELRYDTSTIISGAKSLQVKLVDGIASAHLYVAKFTDSKNEEAYRKHVNSLVTKWKEKENTLNTAMSGLKEKEIWLNRGAWAARSAKWGFEVLSVYNKYQEDKAKLMSTDLGAETENTVLALTMAGKAIETVVSLIPIPVLEKTLKSYAKLLSDAATWASAMDSLQAIKYQDLGFNIRNDFAPAAYKSLMENDTTLKPVFFYRTRMPLAEYNGLTILAYPNSESTETRLKRDRMWLIWDKHSQDGSLPLDKETFEKVSLYSAWYRRVHGKNISGKGLYDLIKKGEIETTSYWVIKDIITPDTLKEKAEAILRLKALEAYFYSLTGRKKFEEEEIFTYRSMLYKAAEKFAQKGFLLSDPDVKEIMEAVFYEKPISGNWKTLFDIFSMSSGSADRFNEDAANWDKLTGRGKERLDAFLTKFIEKKIAQRTKAREESWKAARISEETGKPVAAGLLFSETGLVFNHGFFSNAGEMYSDDYKDISTGDFTITWETVLPDDIDVNKGTYICIAEIAGYPNTRMQFAFPMDTEENDILKQMIELAETAEVKGDLAWSDCQLATAGINAFAERKADFLTLVDKLKELKKNLTFIMNQAGQAPDSIKRYSSESIRISNEILKQLTEVEELKNLICEHSDTEVPNEIERQTFRINQIKRTIKDIKVKSRHLKKQSTRTEKTLEYWNEFEKLVEEYDRLVNEETGWAKELSDGFAKSLKLLSDVEVHKKELTGLKNKGDKLLTEAKQVYSAPESKTILEEIKNEYNHILRPLNELTDCQKMAMEKKDPNKSLWQTISPELTQAEVINKKISKKWEKLSLKKEEIETMSQEILERWNTTHAEILKGENSVADAEECMGIGPAIDGEAEVPDVAGASMQTAKSKIKRAGFKPVFKGGNPAPLEKQAYTVASQKPEAGEVLERGQSVNIILYGMFAGNKIPDVVGLSSKKAKERIEKAGFKITLAGGDPAPSEKLKFKVQSQEPEAGEIAEPGTPVKIRIYGDIHYVNVPSIVSMTSSQAKSAVSGAGLVPNLMGGISAPKNSLSYRVEIQAPDPGTKVLHGSTVSILVYGKFNEIAALENAHCNNLAGSLLKWDYQEERAICACPSRTVINKAGNACIEDPRIQQQRDQRNQFWSAVIQTAVPIIIKEITKDDKPSGGNRSGGNSSGGNRSGGNTSGGTSFSSGGSGSTSGNTGLTMGDATECELKFCPECKEADKGIDLFQVAISPQCNDCRKREKTNIDKCIRGEKTGRGTERVKKDYVVVSICKINEYTGKKECVYSMGKSGKQPSRSNMILLDTWKKCVDRLHELGVGGSGDPSSF